MHKAIPGATDFDVNGFNLGVAGFLVDRNPIQLSVLAGSDQSTLGISRQVDPGSLFGGNGIDQFCNKSFGKSNLIGGGLCTRQVGHPARRRNDQCSGNHADFDNGLKNHPKHQLEKTTIYAKLEIHDSP